MQLHVSVTEAPVISLHMWLCFLTQEECHQLYYWSANTSDLIGVFFWGGGGLVSIPGPEITCAEVVLGPSVSVGKY
jgi:hypothetical protein